MATTFAQQVEKAVLDAHAHESAHAAKRGRRKEWPYVPIVRHRQDTGLQLKGYREEQIRGRAYATREEAIAYAERVILARKNSFRTKLYLPNHRALRQQWGLPETLPENAGAAA